MALLSGILVGCSVNPPPASEEQSESALNASEIETRASASEDGEGGKFKPDPGKTWEPDKFPDDKFPPTPPGIPSALACSQSVFVESCVENAIVELSNRNGSLGTAIANKDGTVTFSVPPLVAGDILWAVQTINSRTSDKSAIRVVERLREPLPQPRINHPAWECGRRVGSDGIVPGVELILSKSDIPISSEWPTEKYGDYWATKTENPLAPIGAKVSVQQDYCADPTSGESTQYGPVSESRAMAVRHIHKQPCRLTGRPPIKSVAMA